MAVKSSIALRASNLHKLYALAKPRWPHCAGWISQLNRVTFLPYVAPLVVARALCSIFLDCWNHQIRVKFGSMVRRTTMELLRHLINCDGIAWALCFRAST